MREFHQILDIFGQYAESIFLIDTHNDEAYSFKRFHQNAINLATKLRNEGINRGNRIAIVLNNSAEFVTLYFACLYLGVVAVPINPHLQKKEIAFILNHSDAKMLIYSAATEDTIDNNLFLQDDLLKIRFLSNGNRENEETESLCWHINEDESVTDDWQPFDGVSSNDLFIITFTSGTTGLPKGVSHNISDILENAILFNLELGFGPANRFYHVIAMSYMAGILNTIFCPFLAGASVVVSDVFDARSALRFWMNPIKYNINTLWMVPTMLAILMRIDRDDLGLNYCRDYIKSICVGTAPLPVKLKTEFEEKYGVILYESYGLSETLFISTNSNKTEYFPGSVGRILPGIEIKIVNEEGIALSEDQDGEIFVHSPCLMAGYLNYDSLQIESSKSQWFHSGDIGHLNKFGYLFITGRKKDLIIRGGLNISPRAIEETLLRYYAIEQTVVIGIPSDFYGEEVVAVVQLKDNISLDSIRPLLIDFCKKNLSVNTIPSIFIEIDKLPLSSTGKVKKTKLKELLSSKLPTKKKSDDSRR